MMFSRVVNILIKDLLGAHGAIIVGERYFPSGLSDMDELAADIAGQEAGNRIEYHQRR